MVGGVNKNEWKNVESSEFQSAQWAWTTTTTLYLSMYSLCMYILCVFTFYYLSASIGVEWLRTCWRVTGYHQPTTISTKQASATTDDDNFGYARWRCQCINHTHTHNTRFLCVHGTQMKNIKEKSGYHGVAPIKKPNHKDTHNSICFFSSIYFLLSECVCCVNMEELVRTLRMHSRQPVNLD